MNERLVPADPVRLLLSVDSTDLEKELLRSWEGERPAEGARGQTLAALGLAGAAAGGAAVAAGGSLAPKAAGAGWLAVAKWVTLGVAALGLTVAGLSALRPDRQAEVSAPSNPAPAIVEHLTPAPTAASTAPVETSEARPMAPVATAARAPLARTTRPASDSLSEQIAELDRARAALDGGSPERALRLVDAYEASYPSGALVQEAELLRVEALVRAGNQPDAERAGKRFLAAYPKSPHAARVRALLGNSP